MAFRTRYMPLKSGINGELREWPDLVGQTWKEAEFKIRQHFPNMTIQVLPEDSNVSTDYCPDRVRIFINGDGMVMKPPKIE